jgi:Tol biopolymer transport system component
MRSTRMLASVLVLVCVAGTLIGCGSNAVTSATPTSVAVAPTEQPTLIGGGQPTLPPASSISPTSSAPVVTAEASVSPTAKVATVVQTETPRPATSSATPTTASAPRPAAATGRIAYSIATGFESKFHSIVVANANGSNARPIITHAWWPTFSPDGRQIAYYSRPDGGSEGMYLANADGTGAILVLNDATVCCFNWSRDGQWMVFTDSNIKTKPGGPIKMVKMDGIYKNLTITELKVDGNGPSFSPDGKQIVFTGNEPGTGVNGLHTAPTDGSGAVKVLTRDNGGAAQWSPDGQRIVYHAPSDDQHRQVYVINANGSGKKQLTTGKGNDIQPMWSRDGSTIFYRSDQNGTGWAIYAMNADGTNHRRLVADAPPDQDMWGWESLAVAP